MARDAGRMDEEDECLSVLRMFLRGLGIISEFC
jgi:hypothetical protein